MAIPFITRYYEGVTRQLGDPSSSVRYTRAQRYEDLRTLDARFFNRLLGLGLSSSLMGYAEAPITLEADRINYPFPPGFRQFLRLEKRSGTTVVGILNTSTYYDENLHIDILDAASGFRISPGTPSVLEGDWTLCYLRSPGLLHYANAKEVGDNYLVGGGPSFEAGQQVRLDDYYNGMALRVVSADKGEGQQIRIIRSFVSDNGMVFQLAHAFSPVPTGSVLYEVCPTLPLDCDKLYAVQAAIDEWGSVRKQQVPQSLLLEREELWATAKTFFGLTTADRSPTRVMDYKQDHLTFTPELPW